MTRRRLSPREDQSQSNSRIAGQTHDDGKKSASSSDTSPQLPSKLSKCCTEWLVKLILGYAIGSILRSAMFKEPIPLERDILVSHGDIAESVITGHGIVSLNTLNSSNPEQQTAIFYSALNEHGQTGFVADPQSLRRRSNDETQWNLLTQYADPMRFTPYGHFRIHLSSDYVCALSPGQSLEEDGGYKMLTEKVRLLYDDHGKNAEEASQTTPHTPKRILCLVYTHQPMYRLARAAALTWGRHCDGFLAFTNTTMPELGMVHLDHLGSDAYGNMYQKVRSIWAYVHDHYIDDFDYFHICGDDAYILVPNLRRFVSSIDDTKAVFAGQIVPFGTDNNYTTTYVAGGAGYTLNQAALKVLIRALPSCHPKKTAAFEDRLISGCLQREGVSFYDTRDHLGQQRYHDCSPHHLFTSRASTRKRASFHSKAAAFWETLPRPNDASAFPVGAQTGLDAASASTVAFHDIYSPLYMVRLHAILTKSCPPDSVLGRALLQVKS